MSDVQEPRDGEVAVALPPATDAGLIFIGRIDTPWRTREDAPKQGKLDGPVCEIELFEPWPRACKASRSFHMRRCCTGCISRGATSFCNRPSMTPAAAAPLRYARQSGPTRSVYRPLQSSASKAMLSGCAASIASTARR